MNDFFEKDEYTIEDIQGLITNHIEESLNLDFKAAGALHSSDSKKKEIAKDVSAMANSAGGIIVYGITEQNHVASEVSFIDGNTYTKEWLEHVINTNIHRRIPGLRIFPVRNQNNAAESMYIVRVPESSLAPHMTSDKRYYKRYNFESVPMEEHEIRAAYSKRQKTELVILDPEIIGGGGYGKHPELRWIAYTLHFQIKNIGLTIETLFKMELQVPINIYLHGENVYALDSQAYPKRREGDMMIFSIQASQDLFQGEQMPMGSLSVRVKKPCLNDVMNNPVITKLYYSNDVIERQFLLGDLLFQDGVSVRDLNFINE